LPISLTGICQQAWNYHLARKINDIYGDDFPSGVRLLDFDSDGQIDLLRHRRNDGVGGPGEQIDLIKSEPTPSKNLLTKIISPFGAVTTVTYDVINSSKPLTLLPFAKKVVKSISVNNGFGGDLRSITTTQNYFFFGGTFDNNKEFLGFKVVSVKDSTGRFTTTTFRNKAEDRCRKGQTVAVVK
jgi:hypothetical protein